MDSEEVVATRQNIVYIIINKKKKSKRLTLSFLGNFSNTSANVSVGSVRILGLNQNLLKLILGE